MKFSSKIQRCELSPMRKFLPYELAAEAKGRKIYHLNIGQPDIETPKAFFDAVKNFQDPVLAYAAAPGVSEFLTAVQGYYANLGIHLEQSDIYATAGGQRGAADGPDLHSGRGRRDPDPGALLSQLQHLCQCHRRRDPAYPHNSGGGLPLRRPGRESSP